MSTVWPAIAVAPAPPAKNAFDPTEVAASPHRAWDSTSTVHVPVVESKTSTAAVVKAADPL